MIDQHIVNLKQLWNHISLFCMKSSHFFLSNYFDKSGSYPFLSGKYTSCSFPTQNNPEKADDNI